MKYFSKKINNQDGVVTLEILLAMLIIILSISSVILLVSGGQDTTVGSTTNQEALYKAQLAIESARATARADFYDPSLDIGTTTSTENSGIVYTKSLTVAPDLSSPDFSKIITSQVSWGSGLKVMLSTIVADWQGAIGGDTCNPILSGDWQHPQLLGYVDFSSSEGATDVDISAKKAYVTSNPASAGEEDFYIFDVKDPTLTPLPNFGSSSKLNTGVGLAAIHVAGKYAFVANMSATSQLQVIDVSTPSAPVVVANLDVTAAGDSAVGNSIFYSNQKIYLGLTKSSGPEFYVIDVSNPLSPSVKGNFETDTKINAITVKNNLAYIATPWPDPSPLPRPTTQENLSILDVSHPSTGIPRVNTFTAADPSTMSGQSVYISKDGNTLYLGRGGLNPAHNPGFFSLNVTNPSLYPLPILKSKYIPTSNNVTVNAIAVRSNFAFLWTSDTTQEFQVWDLNNLGSSTPYASLNTAASPTGGLNCDGNLLYTAQRSNRALQIIGPGNITPVVALAVHDGTHSNITTTNVGGTVHAGATVTGSAGTPTGKIDFTFYSNNSCTGSGTADTGNPFTLDGSGVLDPSSNQGPLSAGSYSFKAHYEGDANYDPANSACQSLTVTTFTPTVTTTIYNNTTGLSVTSVPKGTFVYDKATVSGSAGTPTGTVDFTLYKNKTDCTGTTQVYNNVSLTGGVAQSPAYQTDTGPSAKSISYKVHYNGDATYNAADGVCEPLIVN